MNFTKNSFIEFAIKCNVLKFGEFVLKSGRISPYFFNAGLFYHGESLKLLGQYYAKTIVEAKLDFDHLFGPAYKGLPLATATAIALADNNINKTVTFNRKEAKDHGEGGCLIGAPLHGNTIIIDDVITAGTAFREAKTIIEAEGGNVSGVIIALDRCEKGQSTQSTLQEITTLGIEVHAIITLYDLINYLKDNNQTAVLDLMMNYQNKYGIAP